MIGTYLEKPPCKLKTHPTSLEARAVAAQGEVIGISNLKAIAGDGVSFAIPIDTAKDVINQLLAPGGRVARPYIGCKTLELNSRCGLGAFVIPVLVAVS